MPPLILNLKVGVPIMLLQNLDLSKGLYNGIWLVVRKITKHIIYTSILTGNYKGKDYLIPRIKLHLLKGELPFILCCQQFPVCLYFAMTVNKSQGQLLLIVDIDL
jgi:hypothetical protein